MLPDGQVVLSPSGLGSLLSALSTGFTQLGRVGCWDPICCRGNPVDSADVRDFKAGYGKLVHQLGYEEGSGALGLCYRSGRSVYSAARSGEVASLCCGPLLPAGPWASLAVVGLQG